MDSNFTSGDSDPRDDKANGFDTKTLRTVIRMRKQDRAEREQQQAMVELYLSALGML